MIQKLMLYGIPFSLLISGWYFPIGVIIYWVTNNVFSLGQQYWVLHKYPPPPTASTGAKPAAPARRGAAQPAKAGAARRKAGPSRRCEAGARQGARPRSRGAQAGQPEEGRRRQAKSRALAAEAGAPSRSPAEGARREAAVGVDRRRCAPRQPTDRPACAPTTPADAGRRLGGPEQRR